MSSTNDPPPGRDASYGHILHYWVTTLGVTDRDLADAVAIDRTYPGQIQRGHKLPTANIADAIRECLLRTAKAPGPYGPPPLTESEWHTMDDLLRASFAREDQARRAKRPVRHDEPVPAVSASVMELSSPARRSITPLIAVGLIALALLLAFAGVVYYATRASAPTTLTPQLLYRMITTRRPLFTDALTGRSANGWDERTMPTGGCAHKEGTYHATVLRSAVIQCLAETAPLLSAGTVAVQVDLTFLHGDGGGGLVLCYAGPRAPSYRFVVTPSGYFDLYDPFTGARVDFALPVAASARYRLTAIMRGASILLYVDGMYLAQGTLEPGVSEEGHVGVFAVDGPHNPTDVAFHDFKVWAL